MTSHTDSPRRDRAPAIIDRADAWPIIDQICHMKPLDLLVFPGGESANKSVRVAAHRATKEFPGRHYFTHFDADKTFVVRTR